MLDDWFDTLRTLPCYRRLDEHEVTVWTDHTPDVDQLADRLRDTEALVLIRKRTTITAELLDRLPATTAISERSVYPHIDIDACSRLRRARLLEHAPRHPVLRRRRADLGAGHGISPAAPPTGRVAYAPGRRRPASGTPLRGPTLGIYGYGRIGRAVAGYGTAFGMRVLVLGPEASRKAARPTGTRPRQQARRLPRRSRRRLAAPAAGRGHHRDRDRGRSGVDEADRAAGQHQPRRLIEPGALVVLDVLGDASARADTSYPFCRAQSRTACNGPAPTPAASPLAAIGGSSAARPRVPCSTNFASFSRSRGSHVRSAEQPGRRSVRGSSSPAGCGSGHSRPGTAKGEPSSN